MLIEIIENRMGDIIGLPINKRIKRQIINHLKQFGVESDGAFLCQQGIGAEEFKEEFLEDKEVEDIENGYPLKIRMDGWIVGHLYGWDTHTLFE